MNLTRSAVVAFSTPVLVATLACASRPGAMDVSPTSMRYGRGSSLRGPLVGDELREARGSNAFEIVQRLRPIFLRSRGPLHAPTVFVDNLPRGGVEELRAIPAAHIAEIRFLDSSAATALFGTGYTGGIIQVLTVIRP